MILTSIYSDEQGVSHFRDTELAVKGNDYKAHFMVTETIKASGVFFHDSAGVENVDWHPAPRSQIICVLTGRLEIEVGDGEIRTFLPGQLFVAADTTGKGHLSRATDRDGMYIPLEGEITGKVVYDGAVDRVQ